jgi:alpha-D-xyloside xylohydrolase
MADNAVRVKFFKDAEMALPELVFTNTVPVPKFEVIDAGSKLELKAKNLFVILNKQTGKLSFADHSGNVFLNEKANSRKLTPSSVGDEPCFIAEESFESPIDESIFGLGQFQDGQYNLRGVSRRLTQVNSQISIPCIYSSKGYGILWHQYGLTDFNPADNTLALEKQEKSVGNDQDVEVTTTSGTQKVSQNQTLYTGKFSSRRWHLFYFQDLGDMGNRHFLAIDGEPVWTGKYVVAPNSRHLVELKAGEHQVQLICKSNNKP